MKVNVKKLLEVLSALKPGLARKDVVVHAQSFIFKPGMIFTSNDDVAVFHTFDHELSFAVEATRFYNFLQAVTLEEITIVQGDNEILKNQKGEDVVVPRIKLTAGKAITNIPFDMVKDEVVPIASTIPADTVWSTLPSEFNQMIEMLQMSVSSDLSKPAFTCIHWTPTVIESCDNYRVTRYTVASPGITVPEGLLISSSSFAQLKGYEAVSYCSIGEWVHFKTVEGCVFSCRTFQGKYGNLDAALSFDLDKADSLVFPPEMLTGVLNRSVTIAASEIPGAEQATISIKNKTLHVSVRNPHGGTFDEDFRFNSPLDIAFEVRSKALLSILEKKFTTYISEDRERIKFIEGNLEYLVAITLTNN